MGGWDGSLIFTSHDRAHGCLVTQHSIRSFKTWRHLRIIIINNYMTTVIENPPVYVPSSQLSEFSLYVHLSYICIYTCVGVHDNMHVHTYTRTHAHTQGLSKGSLFVVSLSP